MIEDDWKGTLTGAVFETGEGPRPIRYVLKADLELLNLQPIPEGCDMAVTRMEGVQTDTHAVLDGEVILASA